MGEAKRLNGAVEQAVADLRNGGPELRLTPPQAFTLTTLQRYLLTLEHDFTAASMYGETELQGVLRSAAQHLEKYQKRYMAQCQSNIIVPGH